MSDQDPRFTTHFWQSFQRAIGTVDNEHCFSFPDGRSVRENHPDFRGHASGMRLGS